MLTPGQFSNPWSPAEECPSVEASDGNYVFVFSLLTTVMMWLIFHKIQSNIDDFKNAYRNECFLFILLISFHLKMHSMRDDLFSDDNSKNRMMHTNQNMKNVGKNSRSVVEVQSTLIFMN